MADENLQERLGKHLDEVGRFRETFHAVSAAKIVPVLERARTPFVARGLDSSVVKQYDVDPPLIYLEVPLRGRSLLIYTAFSKTSDIRVSHAFNYYTGSGDEIGRFGLNDITPEIVQGQVDEFIEAAMR